MTISQLARKHGLSRSTLLYYDRIGLLKPDGRLGNDYRHYSPDNEKRLRQIRLYRQTGLPLAGIRKILERPKQDLAAALERQLYEVLAQMEALRGRQRVIVELLKNRRLLEQVRNMDKEKFVMVGARIPVEEANRLRELAKQDQRSRESLIRKILAEYKPSPAAKGRK